MSTQEIKKSLNLGCGQSKITGAVNVDSNIKVEPDVVHHIGKGPLPFGDSTFDEIYFFHCIEHIEKRFHFLVLDDIHRVLKPGGILYISFPEFKHIAKAWLDKD